MPITSTVQNTIRYVGTFLFSQSNNCHHHVADALSSMKYEGKEEWSQMGVEWMLLTKSEYVNWCDILKVYLPSLVIVGIILGLVFGLK